MNRVMKPFQILCRICHTKKSMCPAIFSTMIIIFWFVEVHRDGNNQTKIEMLGFPSNLLNECVDMAKLCPFFQILLEKFHRTYFFLAETK